MIKYLVKNNKNNLFAAKVIVIELEDKWIIKEGGEEIIYGKYMWFPPFITKDSREWYVLNSSLEATSKMIELTKNQITNLSSRLAMLNAQLKELENL